jgi:hypothetical protein
LGTSLERLYTLTICLKEGWLIILITYVVGIFKCGEPTFSYTIQYGDEFEFCRRMRHGVLCGLCCADFSIETDSD